MNQRTDRHRERTDAADMMNVILRRGITWWGGGWGRFATWQAGLPIGLTKRQPALVRSDENHDP
jgi:hypothetical protein